jgi:glycosyltransferase involved in cell wall biosynthesis
MARTGSEIALANLLGSIKAEKFLAILFIQWGKGELTAELPKNILVFRTPFSALLPNNRLMAYINKKIFAPMILWFLIKYFKPSLTYINTITLPQAIVQAKSYDSRVILHIHELEHMFYGLSENDTQNLIFLPIHIIAASERAAQVIRTFGRTDRISVIHSTVNHLRIPSYFQQSEQRDAHFLNKKSSFTWMMAGTLDTNKNPVRFVQIAKKYVGIRKNDRFIWLGSGKSGYALYAKKVAENLGIESNIRWYVAENQAEYLRIFGDANAFLLTSDAESLSLVAIEALSFGKPVVSFDNGGISEILDNKTGIIIPRFDTDKCVRAMLDIASGKKQFDSEILKRRAATFHISAKSTLWSNLLYSLLG